MKGRCVQMGGTWTTQNKIRPGVYINFQQTRIQAEQARRGIVTMPLDLNFGPEQEVVEVTNQMDLSLVFGEELHMITPIREALKKRAAKVLVFRLNPASGGAKAAVTEGALTATAKHTGTKGNDLKIIIEAKDGKFNVSTFLGTRLMDQQTLVSTVEDLQDNNMVTFSGTGALSATAGVSLTGGTNGTVDSNAYKAYRDAAEVYYFNTCALYDVTDSTIKEDFKLWVKRLRDDEGNKVILVAENFDSADYEGVISVKNGVVLEDGMIIDAKKSNSLGSRSYCGSKHKSILNL